MIDSELLYRLLEPRLLESGECRISIYLPIDPEQRDLRALDARLGGLIDTAEARLERGGMDLRARDALLQGLRAFTSGTDFAHYRDPGIALFTPVSGNSNDLAVLALPQVPREIVVVGGEFHIKPLLPLLAINRRFNILALSKSQVRLIRATPFAWEEVALDHLPIEAQAELDSRLESGRAISAEATQELRVSLLVAEPRRIAAAVKAALAEDPAPLVLVADPNVAGNFLHHVQLRQLHPVQLHLNPFTISDAELHAKVLELVQPELTNEIDTVLEQVNARLGTAEPNVAVRLEEILQAAQEGRVDAVVIAEEEILWGRFGEGTLVAHGTPAPQDEDLLNQAAVLTIRNGGRAFAVPGDRLPRQVPAVATLRF
jgi:hypothetical protein